MNWFTIISSIVLVLATIDLLIISLNQQNFFFQVLYTFLYSHDTWKRYRRLKKYLKINTIPIINIVDYEEYNVGFAFIKYDDMIFLIQGNDIYISSYYSHLIKNLLNTTIMNLDELYQDSPEDYEYPWQYLNNQ